MIRTKDLENGRMGMHVGYVRVSKRDQNPELQRRELKAAGCERIFEESISSREEDRPQLRAALVYCREGDVLVVWKLDRLGRSLRELIDLVDEAVKEAELARGRFLEAARKVVGLPAIEDENLLRK
jgi:hypothetical protein